MPQDTSVPLLGQWRTGKFSPGSPFSLRSKLMTIAPTKPDRHGERLRKKRFNNCEAARQLDQAFVDIIDA
jgi:hypothetical protein